MPKPTLRESTSALARDTTLLKLIPLVLILAAIALCLILLGIGDTSSHTVVTTHYAKPAAHTVAVSADPSGSQYTLGTISAIAGSISAMAAVAAVVVPLVAKRRGTVSS